jgi:hypothetical protein
MFPTNESMKSDYITIFGMFLELDWIKDKLSRARCPKQREELEFRIIEIECAIADRVEMN